MAVQHQDAPAAAGTDQWQSALAARMAAFAGRQVRPRRDVLARQATIPAELWQAMGEEGLLGIGLPAEHGGQGGGYGAIAAAGWALAAYGGSLGLALSCMVHGIIARFAILQFGSPAQHAELLPGIAAGRLTAALAISEPGAAAHPKLLRTRALPDGTGHWLLDGEKAWVTNGPLAAVFIVLAITAEAAGRRRFSAFLVPRDTAGLRLVPPERPGPLSPSPHCGLLLTGCRLPEKAILGSPDEAFESLARPFRDVEDAVMAGPLCGALRHLLMDVVRASEAAERAAEWLGALAALLETLEIIAARLAADLDAGRPVPIGASVGFRLLVRHWLEQAKAVPAGEAALQGGAAAVLAAQVEQALGVAATARLARQKALAKSLREARGPS